ncbi:uncharacterized protein METZ01_LOCUS142421 [marine metagenome]|uniref:Uncharacterized protein n=1 Tax=marine metagenome TaxID=408172 RepID=A0A381ZLH1_9ZZZZ|tara:strand:- start:719 stop:994 length:276 start_codon:yes stop_codon:yes gene_type:complete
MRKLNVCLFALGALTIASNVQADPIKDPLPWVGPQIYSAIVGAGNWTPTDFAIARGDKISSVPKLRIAKDVLSKSGIKLPNILETILIWSK